MSYRIRDIAAALGLAPVGNGDLVIAGLAEPADAGPDQMALAMDPRYAEDLPKGRARAAMLWPDADWQALGLEAAIISPRPRYAMSGLTAMLDAGQGWPDGVHPSASVSPKAVIERGVAIGPMAVVMAGAHIGAGTVIGPQSFVGTDARIGPLSFLREGVRVGARVVIGERFIAQPGAVVGGDGFSFVTPEQSAVERARDSLGDQGEIVPQSWARIHSLGSVRIGDDVELGANACIDRGTIRDTVVGNGCKFDNLAQVGHNVVIGNDCMICAQVGIAGSSVLGSNVVLGGQTGVSDNLTIGDNVICGGATKVLSSVPAGRVMLGYPAMQMKTHIETYKAIRRLPRALRDLASLKKSVSNGDGSD